MKPTNGFIHLPHDDHKPVVQIGLNGTLVQDVGSVQILAESSNEREDLEMQID